MTNAVEAQEECFVVGVIGKAGSDQRIHADWIFDGIILPTFQEHFPDFKVLRADHMNTPGIITSQIIDKLLNARLVIADLTFLNPNAFYEIGIRHMTGKPVVHIHQAGEAIPFDISTFLSMEYSLVQHAEMVAARNTLKTLVENVLAPEHKMENPVTQAQGRAQFEATATTPDRLLQTQIEALGARLQMIEQGVAPLGLFSGSALSNSRASSAVARALLTPGRHYGGGDRLPPNEIRFTPLPQTTAEVFEKFIEDFIVPYQSDSVILRKTRDGYKVNFETGSIDHRILTKWHDGAQKSGVSAFDF